ncbi:MAG: dephospho-CoA kinase [Desulfobacteraceae bacterium]|nr:dephospho-CoA kinase [Desulfobacteraceae bacterium]
MTGGQTPRMRLPTAITGGIGSGKSRVASWLAAECELPLLAADQEVRALLEPGEAGWQRLRWLGADFFDPDGKLRKARLRRAIFSDPGLKRQVESALHPLALAALLAKMASVPGRCLIEVPLLYEAGWQDYFVEVVAVVAPETICLERIMRRDQVSEDEAQAAIAAQMPIADKAAQADKVIDNGGAWPDTVHQLQAIKKAWLLAGGTKKA